MCSHSFTTMMSIPLTRGTPRSLITPILFLAIIVTNSDAANWACGHAGGTCTNRYEGCPDGKFKVGLCGGPDYYQCCILDPKVDEEALNRPKWRNCYQCNYSYNDGRQIGTVECLMGQVEEINVVNCTGQCRKEFLKLDDSNYAIMRHCSSDCHQESSRSHSDVHCCWGDLCNQSSKAAVYWLPTLLVTFVASLGMPSMLT